MKLEKKKQQKKSKLTQINPPNPVTIGIGFGQSYRKESGKIKHEDQFHKNQILQDEIKKYFI